MSEPELTPEIAAKLFAPKPESEVEGPPARDNRMQEDQEHEEEEQTRTPEEQQADRLLGLLGSDRKRQANEALIRSLHPGGRGDSEA